MTAVILAGGKGTRIASVRSDIPKPMLELAGKPVLEHQILQLKENGIYDIILIVGHLGQCIVDYFQNGEKWGVSISYIWEKEPLGTGGALFYLKNSQEDFFLINGDILFHVDLQRMWKFHKEKGAKVTLLVHPNNHPYDSTLLAMDAHDCVTQWGAVWDGMAHNCVNAGIHILSPAILQHLMAPVPQNLDRDIIGKQIPFGHVYAYHSPEYVRDMGTPERYYMTQEALQKGIVEQKDLRKPQRAIFLDRDGTINEACGYVTHPEQIVLKEKVAQAIKKINQSAYLTIVITNQPVIARGDCSLEMLDKIHGHMETLLGEEGAYIDDLFFCPHHPDKGFSGEVLEYKINCSCRKPKPGMILQAAEKYGIDLSQSYMIGDGDWDMQAALAAGCIPIGINTQGIYGEKVYTSVYDAVEHIL